MRNLIILILLVVSGTVAFAKTGPRSLPASFYTKDGHRPSKEPGSGVWTAPNYDKTKARVTCRALSGFPPAFDKTRGFAWDGKLVWVAEERCIPFKDALKAGLEDLAKPESPYHLTATVVVVEPKARWGGDFKVEFTVLNSVGEVVAMASELAGMYRHDDAGFRQHADDIVTFLNKDLLR